MAATELREGAAAPDFSAMADDGSTISLAGLRGKWVVLYFYPMDDTPGCTAEACSFRDANDDMAALGAVVLGVSKDNTQSHQRFRDKYRLNFRLLADPEGKIIDAYGCYRSLPLLGKIELGLTMNRSTFLIDPQGVVRKVWRGVNVKRHKDDVLDALRRLSS